MKKKLRLHSFLRKIMRFTATQMVLVVLFCISAYANNANGQDVLDKKISLSIESEKIKTVLKRIEAQTEIKFIFSSNAIQANSTISVSAQNESVKTVLDKILPPLSISYKVADTRVLLVKTEPKTSAVEVLGKNNPLSNVQSIAFIVTGTITDEKGEPLVGASVVLEGTQKGAITDENGAYKLELTDAQKNGRLLVSFVGFNKESIAIGGRTEIKIVLLEEKALEEVVVVGYGSLKKSDMTGSVSAVNAEDIIKTGTISIDQALAGRAAGVVVTQNSGVQGGGASIRIRGISSIRGSEPLYVIDGVLMENTSLSAINAGQEASSQISPLSAINPSDIDNIQILKDASATAIYGSRGANGVILVTTKTGKAGVGKIQFDADFGIAQNPKEIALQDANDYYLTNYEANFNANTASNISATRLDSARAGLYQTTNWQAACFREAALTQNYNLGFSGGNKDLKYFLSTNYYDAEGTIKQTDFSRISVRLNLDADINKILNIGARLNYTTVNSNQASTTTNDDFLTGNNSLIKRALSASPTADLDDTQETDAGIMFYSPLQSLAANNYDNFIGQFIGNMFLNLKVNKNLSFKTEVSSQIRNTNQRYYQKNILPGYSRGGWAKTSDGRVRLYSNINTMTYNTTATNHNLNLVLGQSTEWADNTSTIVSNYGFANDLLLYYAPQTARFNDPDIFNFSATRLVSFFARANYTYKNKLLFTLTGRADGSSKFAENNKFGYFPAAALGYRLTEEKFMKQFKNIYNLKLRASYGITGNQSIQPYQSLNQFTGNTQGFGTPTGGEVLTTIYYGTQLPNPNLKWERTEQLNTGMDIEFYQGRLAANIDFYTKNTSQLLVTGNRIPAHSGFTTFTENLGKMRTTGLDIGLSAKIIQKPNFSWGINTTLSTGKTRIIDMGADYIESGYNQGWVSGGTQRLIIGEELGAFYGYNRAGISQFDNFVEFKDLTQEQRVALYNKNPMAVFTPNKGIIALRPGEQMYEDLNGDGLISEADRKVIGYAQPDFMFGFTTNFSYKNIDLSVNIDGQYGQDIANVANFQLLAFSPQQQLSLVRQRWSPDNPSNLYPRLSSLNIGAPAFRMSSRFLEDGSFTRLQNVTIGYRFPNTLLRKMRFKASKISVSGNNLFMLTKYSGFNPDVSLNSNNPQQMGHDNAGYPVARTVRVAVSFTL